MKDADLANKYVTIEDVTLPADDGVLTVKAAVKSDVAGNEVTTPVEKTDTVTIDTTASITMTIKDGVATDTDNSDGYINNADAKIKTIAGTVSDVEAGQTVTVTLTGQGGATKDITATVGSDGKWETTAIDFNGLSEGQITATAKVVDKAGNSAESTADSTIKDTVIPVPTIKLTEDTAGASETDNISSKGELTIVVDSTENHTTKSTIESVKYVKADGTTGELTGNKEDGTGYALETNTKYTSITVTTVDEAGNKGTATLNNVGIDSHNPDIAVDATETPYDILSGGDGFKPSDPNALGYYENRKAGTIIGKVKVEDNLDPAVDTEYNSGIYKYEWDESKGTAEERSWYSIAQNGDVILTAAGVTSYMNDYENGANELTLTLKAIDFAGNVSTRDVTFKLGNVIGLEKLEDKMSDTDAVDVYGYNGNAESTNVTSDDAEKIWLGQDENGEALPSTGALAAYYGSITDGNIGGGIPAELYAKGGDDFLHYEGLYQNGAAYMGKGNDVVIQESAYGFGSINGGTPLVMTEEGDDIVIIKGDLTSAIVLAGSGDDNIFIAKDVTNGIVDLGSKIPKNAGGGTLDRYQQYLDGNRGTDTQGDTAENTNFLTIGGNITGGFISGGDGKDIVNVKGSWGGAVLAAPKADLGNGDNVLTITGNTVTSFGVARLIAGDGNNKVTVIGDFGGNTNIELGNGNNEITLGSTSSSLNRVYLGNGDNVLKVINEAKDLEVEAGTGHNVISAKNFSGGNITTKGSTDVAAEKIDGSTMDLGDGDTNVTLSGDLLGATMKLGAGANKVTAAKIDNTDISSTGSSTINATSINKGTHNLGAGDDVINLTGDLTNTTVNLDTGNNSITTAKIDNTDINSKGSSTITATSINGGTHTLGGGDDVINLTGNLTSTTVKLGGGENSITAAQIDNTNITSSGSSDITATSINGGTHTLGNGPDNINLTGALTGATVKLGDGANSITSSNIDNTNITGGSDVDTITTGNINTGTTRLGAGNDSVTMGELTGNGWIYLEDGNDTISYTAAGVTTPDGYIDGGAGDDTFVFKAGADVDLTSVNFQLEVGGSRYNIQNFEHIDLTDGHVNALRVLQGNMKSTIYIKGDAGKDVVDIGDLNWFKDVPDNKPANLGNFTKAETTTVDGVQYDHYTNSAYSDGSHDLFIQTGIIVI